MQKKKKQKHAYFIPGEWILDQQCLLEHESLSDSEFFFSGAKNSIVFSQIKNYISFIKNDNKKLKQ